MSDLIERMDAIEAVHCRVEIKSVIGAMAMASAIAEITKNIADIPSADRWIPCEERLPSEQGQYLVTFPLCNGEPWVYVLSFCKGKFYETDDEWGDVEYDDVTAWMPLPKPWKGADDETD